MNPKKIRQHSFHIPKITSLQPLFSSMTETEPTTPIKMGDVRGKQLYLQNEQEKRNRLQEEFLQFKLQKYQNNRKELLYHKLQNIEQKLDKWQQIRKNIELYKLLYLLVQKKQKCNIFLNIMIHNNNNNKKQDHVKLNIEINHLLIIHQLEIMHIKVKDKHFLTYNIKRNYMKKQSLCDEQKDKIDQYIQFILNTNIRSQQMTQNKKTKNNIKFNQNCKSSSPQPMQQTHLHVGQSQPHSSEAPVLQFLGKSRKRKRRSLENNDWISLVDHKIKGNSHTQYLIRVKVGDVVWSFWTRYSMLFELHQTLDSILKCQLPAFPTKRLFGNMNQEFIVSRQNQLNEYLKTLFNDENIQNCKVFQDFLEQSKSKAFKKAELDSLHRFKLDV